MKQSVSTSSQLMTSQRERPKVYFKDRVITITVQNFKEYNVPFQDGEISHAMPRNEALLAGDQCRCALY